MDRQEILNNFYKLKSLVEKYQSLSLTASTETAKIYRQIIELFGKVAFIYKEITGNLNIEVPVGGGSPLKDKYPNFFEAGYLSNRTYHRHQAYTELVKVIGIFESGSFQQKDSKQTISTILNRFRPCCNYLKLALECEKDVQDILWIMLRSNFAAVEREETLKKFGLKNYRPDFGISEFKSLVEVKYINEKTDTKKIQEEILADSEGYLNKNTEYQNIFVFIYDKAHKLMDPESFIMDLKNTKYIIDVIIIPGI
jgi:hypothetical protein